MSNFNESEHRRSPTGTFDRKLFSEPSASVSLGAVPDAATDPELLAVQKRREAAFKAAGEYENMVPWGDMMPDEISRAMKHFGGAYRPGTPG